jgi:putative colanic acid biosysnthesis UDP-glucose lipid carrier transferase
MKRLLDVIVGATLLLLFAPTFAVIASLIKALGGPGPVFTRQRRISTSGASFLAWQFRSVPSRGSGPTSGLWHSEEPLLIRLGSWLRRSNLDQFPMLLNVVQGDIGLLDIVRR